MKKIKVVELFAGVGGFRIGLDAASNKSIKYETIWNSQWEPGMKTQHASEIYQNAFGSDGHSCEDIANVVDNKFDTIPDHNLLVGGFPCQDYSVARTASQSKGLQGKKGVLWWSIYDILLKKGKNAPEYILLENVDRLLKSPTKQRGRDFAVMLSSLSSLGYIVEWRVINAAEYGFPQRRRRVFILGYKKGTKLATQAGKSDPKQWIESDGVIAGGFKVCKSDVEVTEFTVGNDIVKTSHTFSKKEQPKISPFLNSGIMINGVVYTKKLEPKYSGKYELLRDVLIDEKDVPKEFYIDKKSMKKWKDLKGAKSEKRVTKDGFKYNYSEGSMIFPDNLNNASRTIVTGEGGVSPSRFKHVVEITKGKPRRLTPLELERLNMFPGNHTQYMLNDMETSDTKRAFIMGNALVVGVIEKLGKALIKKLS